MVITISMLLIQQIIEYIRFQQVQNTNNRIFLIKENSLGSFVGTTVAGNPGSAGSGLSELNSPSAVYVDSNQNMFILDTSNYRVLRWKIGDPLGYVVAGVTGSASAALTRISTSYAMYVDSQSNVYVSDSGNARVTKWSPTNTTYGMVV